MCRRIIVCYTPCLYKKSKNYSRLNAKWILNCNLSSRVQEDWSSGEVGVASEEGVVSEVGVYLGAFSMNSWILKCLRLLMGKQDLIMTMSPSTHSSFSSWAMKTLRWRMYWEENRTSFTFFSVHTSFYHLTLRTWGCRNILHTSTLAVFCILIPTTLPMKVDILSTWSRGRGTRRPLPGVSYSQEGSASKQQKGIWANNGHPLPSWSIPCCVYWAVLQSRAEYFMHRPAGHGSLLQIWPHSCRLHAFPQHQASLHWGRESSRRVDIELLTDLCECKG